MVERLGKYILYLIAYKIHFQKKSVPENQLTSSSQRSALGDGLVEF